MLVTAEYDGKQLEAGVTEDGKYGYDPLFVVPDTKGNLEGKVIKFFVNGEDTGESHIFNNQETSVTELDLELSGVDFCGDNKCSGSEDCEDCPDDCGECEEESTTSSTSSSSSSSGSSGSSSSKSSGGAYIRSSSSSDDDDSSNSGEVAESTDTKECTPDWVCSEWMDCMSGKQKRVCVDSNRCGVTEDKPSEERECMDVKAKPEPVQVQFDSEPETDNKATGAFLGFGGKLSPVMVAVVGFLAIIVIGGSLLAYIRR